MWLNRSSAIISPDSIAWRMQEYKLYSSWVIICIDFCLRLVTLARRWLINIVSHLKSRPWKTWDNIMSNSHYQRISNENCWIEKERAPEVLFEMSRKPHFKYSEYTVVSWCFTAYETILKLPARTKSVKFFEVDWNEAKNDFNWTEQLFPSWLENGRKQRLKNRLYDQA